MDAQTAVPAAPNTASDTASHRVLELPKNGSADLRQQMFLLQRLKSLIKGEQPDATPPEQLPPQLQQLKDLYDQFGGQIPESMLPRPEDISPELIQQVKSNPQLKRQVQQMLEQYQRDGRFPESNGQSGSQMPPSSRPPNAGGQSQPRPGRQPRSEPATAPNESIRPADRRPDPRPNGSQPRQPPTTEGGSQLDQPGEQNSSRRADALRRLKDMWEKANPEDSTNPAAQPRQNTQPPGTPSGNANGINGPLPDSPEGWDELLKNLIQQQRDAANGNQPEQNLPSAEPSATIDSSGQPRPGQASNLSTEESKPSVKEFLKQMRGVVPQQYEPFPSNTNTDTADADAAVAEAKREAVAKRQQETKDSLRDQGLKATLKKILQDAKQKSKEATAEASKDPDASAGEAGMSTAMLKVLNGVRKDVVQMVLDGDITLKTDPNNPDDSNPGDPVSDARPGASESMLGGFREAAGNMISDLSTPEVPTPPDSASAAEAAADAVNGISIGGWVGRLLIFLVIVVFVTWRTGLLKDVTDVLSNGQQANGGGAASIRTKADVVRAFHAMALQPVRKTKSWWTHQMVTRDIAAQAPAKTDQVSVLAELYERARYLPDEQAFTAQQIQDARRALQQCEER